MSSGRAAGVVVLACAIAACGEEGPRPTVLDFDDGGADAGHWTDAADFTDADPEWAIVGVWDNVHPDCSEVLTVFPNRTFEVTATPGMRIGGPIVFHPPTSTARGTFTTVVLQDNRAPGCFGSSMGRVGSTQVFYLEFAMNGAVMNTSTTRTGAFDVFWRRR